MLNKNMSKATRKKTDRFIKSTTRKTEEKIYVY